MKKLIRIDQCRPGAGTFVEYDGRELAVFLRDNATRVVVIDNACPHASGNLSGGSVQDNIVTCPWHDWQFNLDTGACVHSDQARVVQYPAELRDGWVWADV